MIERALQERENLLEEASTRMSRTQTSTCLHRNELLRRLGRLPAHLSWLDDPNDHLTPSLDSFEGRCCRGVMIVLDGLDLFEDLCADSTHLQRQVLPLQPRHATKALRDEKNFMKLLLH